MTLGGIQEDGPGIRDWDSGLALTTLDETFEERPVDRILRSVGILRANQSGGTGDWHERVTQLPLFGVRRDLCVRQTTRAAHEINHHFVGDADDHMLADIGVSHVRGRVVGEYAQSALDARHIVRRIVDQQVDVFREARPAVRDQRETADEDVARPGDVQRSADADEIFRLRRSCVRRIVSVIHVLASSKLLKR